MKLSKSTILSGVAAAILLSCTSVSAKINGSDPITADEYQKILGRGIAVSWYKNKFSDKGQGDDLRDFRARGFDHARLRVNAEIFSGSGFDQMETEINRYIGNDLIPVISWINHAAESNATEADKANYVAWWTDLAQRFKGQHLVAFNLFTEINDGTRIYTAGLFNPWMQEAVDAIRAIDPHRIIILSSPNKTQKKLDEIDPAIYSDDDYMMVEWHLYAAGPKQDGGQKNWVGNGSTQDRLNVTRPLDEGQDFARRTGVECYFGAWMPMDNATGTLEQDEIENFARFFLDSCSDRGIPWAVNADQHFYDAGKDQWLGFAATTTSGKTYNMEPITEILVTRGDFGEGVNTDLGKASADAGYDEVYTADENGFASVTLNGTNSTGTIVSYEWSNTNGVVLGTSALLTTSLEVGVHEISLTITDDQGATNTDKVIITVNSFLHAVVRVNGRLLEHNGTISVTAGTNGVANIYFDSSESTGNIKNHLWKTYKDETNLVKFLTTSTGYVNFSNGVHDINFRIKENSTESPPPVDRLNFTLNVVDPSEADDDNDGIPDAWENKYFGNTGPEPTDDDDHDGSVNYDEYIAGTIPTNAASVFMLNIAGTELSWDPVEERRYELFRASTLTNTFESLGFVENGTTNPASSAASGFYQLKVSLP